MRIKMSDKNNLLFLKNSRDKTYVGTKNFINRIAGFVKQEHRKALNVGEKLGIDLRQ